MTPHLNEAPWTDVARELQKITGRNDIVNDAIHNEYNVDMDSFREALREVVEGRVEVSRMFLVRLFNQVPWYAKDFGLDSDAILEAGRKLPEHEFEEGIRKLIPSVIRRDLVTLPNVRIKG